jgi:hypothetical protein
MKRRAVDDVDSCVNIQDEQIVVTVCDVKVLESCAILDDELHTLGA